MGVHIKSTRGVTLCNFAVTVSYKYFYSSKKIECFHPSLLNTSTCRLNHPRFIVVDLRALGNKLCKLWQNMIGSTDSKWKNGLIGSARTCVTNVMHFALLQDFDLSHWHPSGRRACLIFALQKIGMAFKGFTVSTAENCLSLLYNFKWFITPMWLWHTWQNFCFITLPESLWQAEIFVRSGDFASQILI